MASPEASAVEALNEFMSTLHRSDLWIPRETAKKIVAAGEYFLRALFYLSFLSTQKGEPKFALKSKVHMFHECVWAMRHNLEQEYVLNILCESCSIDEDMVGRQAFISRHVNPRQIPLRSIQRYLTQLHCVLEV